MHKNAEKKVICQFKNLKHKLFKNIYVKREVCFNRSAQKQKQKKKRKQNPAFFLILFALFT